MSNVCQCCGRPIRGSRCGYCGFVEIIDMDGSGAELVRNMAEKHRKNIIAALTDLSIISYTYQWNAERSRLEMHSQEELSLAAGADCYPHTKWTGQAFAQMPATQDITLELSYKYKNNKKRITCTIPTVRCDDFWKIGFAIDRSLKLTVLLGTQKNHTQSAPMDLELC